MARVTMNVARWKGDHQAAKDEDHSVLAALDPTVDGHPVRETDFKLVSNGFVYVEIRGESLRPFITYTPEQFLQETVLILPVTELEIRPRRES